jgi:alpha-L-arabinofuranosidase
VMTAYAPLLARYGFVQWPRANLIWFDQDQIVKTPNYHVQQLFSTLLGDRSLENEVKFGGGSGDPAAKDAPVLAVSPTLRTSDGTLVLKLVNPMTESITTRISLAGASTVGPRAELIVLAGGKDDSNDRTEPERVRPVKSTISVGRAFEYTVPPMSVQILQIATRKNF